MDTLVGWTPGDTPAVPSRVRQAAASMYGPGPYPVHPEVFARPELDGPPYLRTRVAHPAALHTRPRRASKPARTSAPARTSGALGRAGRAELVSAGDAVLRRAVEVLRGGPAGAAVPEAVEEEGRTALALVRGAGRLYREAAEEVAR
jgi:hypothetical protein